MKHTLAKLALTVLIPATPAAAVAGNNNEPNRHQILEGMYAPELFGTTLRWFGGVDSFIEFDAACVFAPGEELGPAQRCVVINPAPAATEWNERRIATLALPGNTFKNVICPVFLHIINYQLRNTTAVSQPDGRLDYRTSITIESEVFREALDPATGMALNGEYDMPWGRRLVSRSMVAGERQREILQFSRACNAGVSKANLEASGFAPALVDALFRGPMSIHLNITGSARLLESGSASFAMRVMGN